MVKEEEYLLTNQEILGGLKSALERGQTLKQAMMSFYQAGYRKEEIEDAARAYLYLQRGASEAEVLNESKLRPKVAEKNLPNATEKVSASKPEKTEKIIPKFTETKVLAGAPETKKGESKKVVQKISGYDDNANKPLSARSKALTVTLIITLAVLLGILALVFLFKAELVNFINGLFG